jgi:hypothetical protein
MQNIDDQLQYYHIGCHSNTIEVVICYLAES